MKISKSFLILLLVLANAVLAQTTALEYFERTESRFKQRDYEGAIADLTKAIELEPKNALYYYSRGRVRESLKSRDLDGAIADYTKAIELDPGSADYYRKRAQARSKKKDHDGSIADYTILVALRPKDAYPYYARARIRYEKRDLEGAIADFTKAIERAIASDPKDDPLTYSYYSERAKARFDNKDIDGAIVDYSQAIEYTPTTSHLYSARGVARAVSRKLDYLTKAIVFSIQLDPPFARSYDDPSNALSNMRDPDGALADFSKAIDLAPESGPWSVDYFNRGVVRYYKKDFSGAISDFTKVIELDPLEKVAYAMRAESYKAIGNLDAAVADYTAALRSFQYKAILYRLRAAVYRDLGKLDLALADEKEAAAWEKPKK